MIGDLFGDGHVWGVRLGWGGEMLMQAWGAVRVEGALLDCQVWLGLLFVGLLDCFLYRARIPRDSGYGAWGGIVFVCCSIARCWGS
jgi:hypothetical protein